MLNTCYVFWKKSHIVYLDFQKAFDKVPHQRLLLKLKAHGIGDSINDWIEQWLTDRRQRVVIDEEVSNWKSVMWGTTRICIRTFIILNIYILMTWMTLYQVTY